MHVDSLVSSAVAKVRPVTCFTWTIVTHLLMHHHEHETCIVFCTGQWRHSSKWPAGGDTRIWVWSKNDQSIQTEKRIRHILYWLLHKTNDWTDMDSQSLLDSSAAFRSQISSFTSGLSCQSRKRDPSFYSRADCKIHWIGICNWDAGLHKWN